MLRIKADRLCFAFHDAEPIIEDASFELQPGFYGLVGANGAGKTSLLRLLTGDLERQSGSLRMQPAGARVVLCEQELAAPTPEIRAFASARDRRSSRVADEITSTPLERWSSSSSGERKRWQIAAAIASEPDVLLLDEPSNHLDASARDWFARELRRFRGICLIVSHDRELLNCITTHTLRVHDRRIALFSGPYERARQAWDEARRHHLEERAQLRDRARDLSHTLQAARTAQASATRARNTGRRMKNRHDSDARSILASTRAEWAQRTHGRKVEIVRRELERTRVELGASNVTKERGGHVFARFVPSKSELIAYRERAPLRAGECVLVDLPALALRRADRIWIAGPNGAGKTTLMRALMTNLRVPADEVLMIPQELSVADIRAALDTIRALAPDARGRVLSIIAALGSDPGRLLVSESLSPGEARKLLLALGLGRLVAAVLLDEPTNHLDLPCIERLEAVLQSYPGALVLSSHDEALARRCTSVRWALGGADIEVESTAG